MWDFGHFTQNWIEGIGIMSASFSADDVPYHNYIDQLQYARICGVEYGTPLHIDPATSNQSLDCALLGIYPNPISSTSSRATLRYAIADDHTRVRISLHDMMGREIRVLVDEIKGKGEYQSVLDVRALRPGVYFCRMLAEKKWTVKKMVVTP